MNIEAVSVQCYVLYYSAVKATVFTDEWTKSVAAVCISVGTCALWHVSTDNILAFEKMADNLVDEWGPKSVCCSQRGTAGLGV